MYSKLKLKVYIFIFRTMNVIMSQNYLISKELNPADSKIMSFKDHCDRGIAMGKFRISMNLLFFNKNKF